MSDARAAVDAIVARDGLHLDPEDYERLISQYADLLPELELLRPPNVVGLEPAPVFSAH